ncbi:hypothetical protein [Elizabethkingia bruuniana]|uniref:hypothetical protein n=1 Tax=Elizabethkingia bruuniana TaxID=1756149 RepID=UPI002012C235|nr:hypothetical protein [Elizabethkingia bruuniana]MCL1636280.1 hypothetical protein [Elizabethkingia bruuniana]
MKRLNNLFEKIICIDNLKQADINAQKRKSKQYGVKLHNKNNELNIIELYNTLKYKQSKPNIMKHFAKMYLCSGHPSQYGDCESCHKKVAHQTYSLTIYKEVETVHGVGRNIVSSTYGHEECLKAIINKHNAEIINS